jgi:formate dehydrogenase major subunit
VVGANPAENHPCGWKWGLVARDTRGAKIIHVDPRFTRTSAVSDMWVPIRAGTDVVFFGGLINHVLENGLFHDEYVKLHTNASFIESEDFGFHDGLFTGYSAEAREYDPTTWNYERQTPPRPGDQGFPLQLEGFAERDTTLQHPRCVFQILSRHFARYTPEMVEQVTGIPQDTFLQIAETFGATGAPDRAGNIV